MDEKDRIGVIIYLDGYEYQLAISNWGFKLPNDYEISLKQLESLRHVAFVVDKSFKSVAEIDQWSFGIGPSNVRSARLIARSDDVSELVAVLQNHIPTIRWLTNSQKDIVQKVMSEDRVKRKPTDKLRSMDLREASLAISRRFNVDPDQVQITIRSKTVPSVEKPKI
ncbi:hypothetical protein [Pseudomonas piscis]